MRKAMFAGAASLLLLTGGCGMTREQVGGVVGGVAGGALGNLAGKGIGGRGARTAGTVLGAGAGAILGSGVGRMLDERDRERQRAATMAVLRQPLPPNFYQTSYNAAPRYNPPASYGRYAQTPGRSYGSADTRTGSSVAPAPATSAPLTGGRLPNVPSAPQVRWVSEHSGASGVSTIISAEPPSGGRGECRTVQEVAQKAGQQASDTSKHCESAPGAGDWTKI